MVKKVKKKKTKLGNIFITTSLVALLFISIGIYFITSSNLNFGNNLKGENKVDEPGIEEPKEEYYNASMIMAGDNLIHSSVYKDASDGSGGYDFRKMYELIKPIVSEYDIAYYNQETILGGKQFGYSSYPTFNSPQEVGDAMID